MNLHLIRLENRYFWQIWWLDWKRCATFGKLGQIGKQVLLAKLDLIRLENRYFWQSWWLDWKRYHDKTQTDQIGKQVLLAKLDLIRLEKQVLLAKLVVRLKMMRKIWKTWLDLKIGTFGKVRLDQIRKQAFWLSQRDLEHLAYHGWLDIPGYHENLFYGDSDAARYRLDKAQGKQVGS